MRHRSPPSPTWRVSVPKAIFLDHGGVLYDHERMAPEWRRVIGEYLSTHFGGEAARWGNANHEAFARWFETYTSRAPLVRGQALRALLREIDGTWLQDLFRINRQPIPQQAAAAQIARALLDWGAPRIEAAFPAAAEAVRTLRRAGFRLFLASASDASTLEGYLEGMGIRDCIERPYGVDLAGVAKAGPDFYRAIFTNAGIDPAEAVVVDDRPEAAAWAAEAGAGLAVMVGRDIPALADLPSHLGVNGSPGVGPRTGTTIVSKLEVSWFEGWPAPNLAVTQVYGFCYDKKWNVLLLDGQGVFGLPGGKPETGETYEATLKREALEEAQVELLDVIVIGYQLVQGDRSLLEGAPYARCALSPRSTRSFLVHSIL